METPGSITNNGHVADFYWQLSYSKKLLLGALIGSLVGNTASMTFLPFRWSSMYLPSQGAMVVITSLFGVVVSHSINAGETQTS